MSDCLFCKIVARELPTELVYEDTHCVAFDDISPQAPVHSLIIPRVHLVDLNQAEDPALLGHLLWAATRVAAQKGLNDYRTVINTGAEAGQSVFHLHLHILGGRAMRWPPG